MKKSIRTISFYDEFHCIGKDCPKTCCKGWVVFLDEETLTAQRREKGLKKLYYRVTQKKLKSKDVCIRMVGRSCPHHRGGLCQMQCENRLDLMPLICRTYPRRNVEFPDGMEITMELSCVEAARIFYESIEKRLSFQEREIEEETLPYSEFETLWEQGNVDPEFLGFLRSSREDMLDLLWGKDPTELLSVENQIYDYVKRIQRWIVRDKLAEAKGERLKGLPFTYGTKNSCLFLPITLLNEVIYTQVPFWPELLRDVKFFELMVLYRRTLGPLLETEAETTLSHWYQEMVTSHPSLPGKYRAYFSYCLQELWCNAFEDYHVLRQFLYAAVYTDLLKICDILVWKKKGQLSAQEEIETLAAAERGFRHSISLRDSFLNQIRKEFL